MAIVVGQKSIDVNNPGSSVVTHNHTQDVGANGFLVVCINHDANPTIQSIKYNGVLMTQRLYYSSSQFSSKWGFWVLANPATGSNEVRVDFNVNVNQSVCMQVFSFTGASSSNGVVGNNDLASRPHSRNRTGVTAGSRMILMSTSSASPGTVNNTIDGVVIFKKNVTNGARRLSAGVSNSVLPAGTINATATTNANWKTLSNQTLEIKEFVSTTPVTTVSPTTLSGFTYVDGSGPSTAQSITYSIADATGDLVVTAPTNYELSNSEAGTYVSSFTHGGPPTGPFTTYVRLKTGLAVNTYTGDITLVSSGATTKTVALSGSVTELPRRRIIIC